MKSIQISIHSEYIRLCDLLKLADLADSGASGKQLVAQGFVSVDGAAESRKTAKIRAGQVVACNNVEISVTSTYQATDI
jgi:ribosome-associated protein